MKHIHEIKETDELYKMNTEDIDKYSECAALAYTDYPLFQYLTNNKCQHNVIKTIIKASIKSMDYQVIGYSSSKEADAIILLTPPNYKGTKAIPFFLGGGIKLFFKTSPLIFFRLLKYETHAMKLKEKHTSHQCWYLYNITVKPDYQKNGMCSKILKPILEYLDKIEQDCYLETHKESNVSLYEHFGFKLVEISCIPNTDIKHFAMLRKYNKNKEV